MPQETSIISDTINDNSGMYNDLDNIVLDLFQKFPAGLTNGELVKNYTLYIDNMPAVSSTEKAKIHARHQSLKGRRSSLMHRGLIKKAGERVCSISNRLVEYYVYAGNELSELQQFKNELTRRKEDLVRIQQRITELEIIIRVYEGTI
jgi:DNA repair ATPase RecN